MKFQSRERVPRHLKTLSLAMPLPVLKIKSYSNRGPPTKLLISYSKKTYRSIIDTKHMTARKKKTLV